MDRVAFLPNERVGLSDMEDGAGGNLVLADQIRQSRILLLPEGRSSNLANSPARVFSGFDFEPFTPNTVNQLTIRRGSGILPLFDEKARLSFGLVSGEEGPDTLIVDFSTATASTVQSVYVRATQTRGAYQNRVFWNPAGPNEFPDNIATRYVAGWSVEARQVGASPPGYGEFVKVAEVALDGAGLVASVTDYRQFYYEGDAANSFAHEWGDGANDRDADRATYGISDSHMWAQLIRRQLSDLIGAGFQTKPLTSIRALYPLQDRFVTVDKPGGPGGDGTYVSIPAAIAALNAANGGTILLRSGTYQILAAIPQITKTISLMAVEDAVFVENQINANAFMLDFGAGAEGSILEGIEFTEHATLSSEQQIKSISSRFKIERCTVSGEVLIAGGQRIIVDQCSLVGSVENDWGSGNALRFAGFVTECTFRQTSIASNVINVPTSTNFGSATGAVSFEDCFFVSGFLSNARLVSTATFDGTLAFTRCVFITNNTATSSQYRIELTSRGSTNFTDCRFEFNDIGAFGQPVIFATSNNDADSLSFENCRMNFNNAVFVGTGNPIYISHHNCKIEGLTVYGAFLVNSADSASRLFFNMIPKAGSSGAGSIKICDSKIVTLSGRVSGTMDMSLIGSDGGAFGDGRLLIDNVEVAGAGQTYLGGGDNCCLVRVFSPVALTRITNCTFTGGAWSYVVYGDANRALMMTDNEITNYAGNVASNRVVLWYAYGIGESPISNITFSNNTITHGSIAQGAVQLNGSTGGGRGVAHGNVILNLGTAHTPSLLLDTLGASLIGNNCSNGVDYGAVPLGVGGRAVPSQANLGLYNVLT